MDGELIVWRQRASSRLLFTKCVVGRLYCKIFGIYGDANGDDNRSTV